MINSRHLETVSCTYQELRTRLKPKAEAAYSKLLQALERLSVQIRSLSSERPLSSPENWRKLRHVGKLYLLPIIFICCTIKILGVSNSAPLEGTISKLPHHGHQTTHKHETPEHGSDKKKNQNHDHDHYDGSEAERATASGFNHLNSGIASRAASLQKNCFHAEFANITSREVYNYTKIFADDGLGGAISLKASQIQKNKRIIAEKENDLKLVTIQNYYYKNYLMTIDHLDLLVCAPPKTGTSNWHRLLIALDSDNNLDLQDTLNLAEHPDFYQRVTTLAGNPEVINHTNHLIKQYQSSLKKSNANGHIGDFHHLLQSKIEFRTENVHWINSYVNSKYKFRIINTRHPFSRLLSAYHSKFSQAASTKNPETEAAFKKYYAAITQKYGPPENGKSFPVDRNHVVPFNHFLKFIVEIDSRNVFSYKTNTHWSPITRICMPCNVDYNYVIRTENLTAESSQFFAENSDQFPSLHVPDLSELGQANQARVKFWQQEQAAGEKKPEVGFNRENGLVQVEEKVLAAYRHVPKSVLKELYEIYKYDFLLFGYDVSQFF